MAVNPIPEGYATLTPFLLVDDAAGLLDFMQAAFDAEILERMEGPDGRVMHALARIGDTRVMVGGATPQWPARPSSLYMYVEDCDVVYARAIAAGGSSLREPTTEFYGDRSSGVQDPSGTQWWIATHVEDVEPEEIQRRSEEVAARRAAEEAAA
jgi:PhnB protein